MPAHTGWGPAAWRTAAIADANADVSVVYAIGQTTSTRPRSIQPRQSCKYHAEASRGSGVTATVTRADERTAFTASRRLLRSAVRRVVLKIRQRSGNACV